MNSAMKPFQILLQSRSSSQQSFPDKISMSSKDMKALNVKAGLVMIVFDCWYYRTWFTKMLFSLTYSISGHPYSLWADQLYLCGKSFHCKSDLFSIAPTSIWYLGSSVLVQCDTVGIICKAWSSKTLPAGTATIHRLLRTLDSRLCSLILTCQVHLHVREFNHQDVNLSRIKFLWLNSKTCKCTCQFPMERLWNNSTIVQNARRTSVAFFILYRTLYLWYSTDFTQFDNIRYWNTIK